MKKLIFVFLLVMLASCKNNNNTEAVKEDTIKESEVVKPKKPNKFIVELEMKYSKSESIRLFANGIFINNNRTMNINLTEKVNKSEDFKIVILDLPENILPDFEVGLGLGTQLENSIEIAQIKISYGEVEIDIAPNDLKNYFYFSKYIDYDPETGKLLTKKIDGKLHPIMYFQPNVINEISE